MTSDKEFSSLAQDFGGGCFTDESFEFPSEEHFLTICRIVEYRTLERAAEKCDKYAYCGFADSAEKCAAEIRAMIKEKE